MAETDPSKLECSVCGNKGLYVDDDGHFYCTNCNSQTDGIFDKAKADEDCLDKGNFGAAVYSAAHKRSVHLPPPSSFAVETHFDDDHIGPIEPVDFGVTPKGIYFKDEDYYNTFRLRYVLGVQLLIQFQCEALVDKCGVTSLICGISASIWMRFLAFTRVFPNDWADKTVLDSEIEYSKDLPTYLQYCKDVVFAGIEPLYKDPTLIEELWNFYEKNRECSPRDIETSGEFDTGSRQKRSRDNDNSFSTPSKDVKKHKDEEITSSASTDNKFQFHNSAELKRDPGADNTQQSSQTCQAPATADEGKASTQNFEDEWFKYLKIKMEEHHF